LDVAAVVMDAADEVLLEAAAPPPCLKARAR
jgi:hypothetical protein